MSLRREFVELAGREGANVRELCRRYGVSPTTGYRWLARYAAEGEAGLAERSRRPRGSPARTAAVVALRDEHPAWGGRKLKARLVALDHVGVPAASTVTAILRRHGRLDPAESAKHTAWQRFERGSPNELWQMDFKGHFALGRGRCHPLTVLDDHSRFSLALVACADERAETVRAALTAAFRRYGLPEAMLADNGAPWGTAGAGTPHTPLTVWLLRLGVAVGHGRAYHPQTQGKDERFHRTFADEVVRRHTFADLPACQPHFDRWRDTYNWERPHEALGLAAPASRYAPSPRPFPEALPPIEYAGALAVRKVQQDGRIHYAGRALAVGKAFHGYPVALRPTDRDHILEVHFCHHPIKTIDLSIQEVA